jgi:hypothetical protein
MATRGAPTEGNIEGLRASVASLRREELLDRLAGAGRLEEACRDRA